MALSPRSPPGAAQIGRPTGRQTDEGNRLGGCGCDVCADALGGLPCSGCMPADMKASAKAETLMGAKALLCVAERTLPCGGCSWETAGAAVCGRTCCSCPCTTSAATLSTRAHFLCTQLVSSGYIPASKQTCTDEQTSSAAEEAEGAIESVLLHSGPKKQGAKSRSWSFCR